MRIYIVPILCFLLCILNGCGTFLTNRSDGGSGGVSITTVTTTDRGDGVLETKTEHTEVSVIQPDNPKDSAKVTVSRQPDGTINTTIGTGRSFDITTTLAGFNMLNKVMWVGIGFVVLGVGIGVVTKMLQWKWSLGMGGVGLLLIAFSYFLGTFAAQIFWIIVIVGFIVLLGYVIWTARNYFVYDKANEENIKLVDYLKNNYMTKEQKVQEFNTKEGIVPTIQSKTTKKLVAQKKAKAIKEKIV